MEQAKRERELCAGIVFWMMNDCWPSSAGWSLIDFYNVPKIAYYAFKRCAKQVISSVDFENGTYKAYLVNDGEATDVKVGIKVLSADRRSVKEYGTTAITLKKHSSQVVFEKEDPLAKGEVLICDVEGEFGKDRAFYHHGKLKIEPTDISFDIDEKSATVRVSAKEKYIHTVMITGDVVLQDNGFSLLPNETRTVFYKQNGNRADVCLSVEAYTLT